MSTLAATIPPPLPASPNPTATSPPPEDLSNPSQSQTLTLTPQPLFIDTIDELKELRTAIAQFQKCYDDLQSHLESIKSSIASQFPLPTPNPPPNPLPLIEKPETPQLSELESLCKTMCSRGVRRYITTHLTSLPTLRVDVPKALKLSPNPPKLVLECLGKFYLQGKKAFTRNSPMLPAREASILILECYLIMLGMMDGEEGNVGIERGVREEAESAGLAWRKRLISEGGVEEASLVDARGLLLFLGCFGVPGKFKREDVRDLVFVAVGNGKEVVGLLRNSKLFVDKIHEIVEWMVKNKLEVDAVDMVYTFGLEEKFNPQTILVSFLRESKDSCKKQKKASQGSASLNDVNKKQLSALKSIKKCLSKHNIDPAKLLPGWQINEKIASLEKDVDDSNRKSGERNKRKSAEPEAWKKSKAQELKRSRYSSHGSSQQKPTAGHIDHNRRHQLDNGLSSHHANNTYAASSSVVYGGPGAGMLSESMGPPGVGLGLSSGSYAAGVHAGYTVDAAGQLINRGAHQYTYHGEAALIERYTVQQPPSVGLTSLYRAAPSVEGFAGNVQNASTVGVGGGRSSASDLYHFADAVAESESYPNSVARGVGGVPAVAAHHPAYLYPV